MADFSGNVGFWATIKVPPILLSEGYNSRVSFGPVDLWADSTQSGGQQQSWVRSWSNAISWDFVRENMAESREAHTKAASRHRREVEYMVRDRE